MPQNFDDNALRLLSEAFSGGVTLLAWPFGNIRNAGWSGACRSPETGGTLAVASDAAQAFLTSRAAGQPPPLVSGPRV